MAAPEPASGSDPAWRNPKGSHGKRDSVTIMVPATTAPQPRPSPPPTAEVGPDILAYYHTSVVYSRFSMHLFLGFSFITFIFAPMYHNHWFDPHLLLSSTETHFLTPQSIASKLKSVASRPIFNTNLII